MDQSVDVFTKYVDELMVPTFVDVRHLISRYLGINVFFGGGKGRSINMNFG
jgi:hypothetical protein